MDKSYRTVLHPTNEMHIIAVAHDKTAALRNEMNNQGITINRQWPARTFYATHDHAMAELYAQEATVRYGREVWPFFIECNACPSALIALHKEILEDPTIPHSTRALTKDESRIVLAQKEVFV